MSWLKDSLTSSIGKKIVMGLTGLFLIVFLVAHLAGNVSLLFDDKGEAFNAYAHFMKHSTLIKISEVILFLGFLIHIVQGIMLVLGNKKARPVNYKVSHTNKKVSWTSKLMGPFGVVILVFLILHLVHFFRYKYISAIGNDSFGNADLYSKVYELYQGSQGIIWVIFYVISMLVIGFHLSHGFQSAFKTLGLNHKKYSPFLSSLGLAYSVLITVAFALIPILIFAGVSF